MIRGVGIDIVGISRMRSTAEKSGRRFLERIFTEGEIAYCLRRRDPYPSFSARFAAKEALIKALHGAARLSLRDIEVEMGDDGKPRLRAGGRLKTIFEEKGVLRAHLSLSHDRDYAAACVVLEG